VRITRVRVRNFRVHRDLDLELAPGLTVIRGPNEAGKSTLQRALEVGLFRRVTAGGSEIDSLRSWDAGEEGRPAVQLDFVQEDLEGTRAGSVLKDFRGSRGTVRLVLDGQTITDPARADELLAELTGIPSEKFFRSTASVRHHEVDDLAQHRQGMPGGMALLERDDLVRESGRLPVALEAFPGDIALGGEALCLAGFLQQRSPLGERALHLGAMPASNHQGVPVALQPGEPGFAVRDGLVEKL